MTREDFISAIDMLYPQIYEFTHNHYICANNFRIYLYPKDDTCLMHIYTSSAKPKRFFHYLTAYKFLINLDL